MNGRKAEVVVTGGRGTKMVEWRFLQPGMVVKVKDREEFPADVVCLASSDLEGKCYIETANIDGETNLKLKNCAKTGMPVKWTSVGELAVSEGVTVEYEPPNPAIHSFTGTLHLKGEPDVALGKNEFLLRGAVLRSTKWMLGLVVYTGKDSKLVLNARETPSKLSTVEAMMNNLIFFIFICDCFLVTLATIGQAWWSGKNDDNLWYVCIDYSDAEALFRDNCSSDSNYADWTYWFTFIILFSNFIPISIYVTVEMVNFGQAYFMDADIEMYDPTSDVPMQARTSNMNGDLGQVEYIFSDKTGTLTCNEMKFHSCSVGGTMYTGGVAGSVRPSLSPAGAEDATDDCQEMEELAAVLAKGDPKVVGFVECLSVCHTVILEKNHATGEVTFQAESPDEEALVDGAGLLGYKYVDKTQTTIVVDVNGTQKTYTVLAIIEFTSTRKRMSCLVKGPNGKHKLLVKGADNIMFDRTAPDGYGPVGGEETINAHLEAFAKEGLRTLLIGERDISDGEASAWLAEWTAASTATTDRAKLMDDVAAKIEHSLTLVGCTAIEDRLQDKVPDTIADLRVAGVKLWVLTGDKMATAINIGYSARLLDASMTKIKIEANEDEENSSEASTALSLDALLTKAVAKLESQIDKLHSHFEQLAEPDPANPFEEGREEKTLGSLAASAAKKAMPCLDPDDGADEDMRSRTTPLLDKYTGKSRKNEDAPLMTAMERQESGRQSNLAGVDLEDLTTEHVALIVDGPSLFIIFQYPELRRKWLRVACFCKVVLACRVSPKQKQQIVKLVQEGLARRPITLAIGDGANDVGMIQEAQIGVGISGKEGRQAVNNSDFAIAQFRFLKRLMLVHGRWNYRRISKVIIWSFYKNIVMSLILIYFTTDCGYSGQTLFEDYVYTGYNFFLGMPIVMVGLFDQDISDRAAMAFPACYVVGREKWDLNLKMIAVNFFQATVEGTFIYYVARAGLNGIGSNSGSAVGIWQGGTGFTADLYVFGTTVYTALVISMLFKVMQIHYTWNTWTLWLGIIFSYTLYFGFLFIYGSWAALENYLEMSLDFIWVPQHMMSNAPFYLLTLLIVTCSATFDTAYYIIKSEFYPDEIDLIRDIDHGRTDGKPYWRYNKVDAPGTHYFDEPTSMLFSEPGGSSCAGKGGGSENGVMSAGEHATAGGVAVTEGTIRSHNSNLSIDDRADMGIAQGTTSSYNYDHVEGKGEEKAK